MTDVEKKLNTSRVGVQSEYYRKRDKQLCNSVDNLVKSFEEELRYMIRNLMHMGMDNALINRNYIRPLQSALIEQVRQMLNSWVNSAFRYQKTTGSEIEKMPTLNEEERDNKMAYLSSGIIVRGMDPDTSNLSNLGRKYLNQFESFFESYEKITGEYSSSHKQHLNDIFMEFLKKVNKSYCETVSSLADELATAYEDVIEDSLKGVAFEAQEKNAEDIQEKKEKQVLNVTDFPLELIPNITSVLSLAGCKFVKEENKFYALDKSTGFKHELVFTGSFNFFHFADEPQKHFWIDVQIKTKDKITDPQDTAWLGAASIFYTKSKQQVSIMSKINNTSYLLKFNDDQSITFKKNSENSSTEMTQEDIRAEIASLYPDVLSTCEEMFGISAPAIEQPIVQSELMQEIAALEVQKAEIDRLIQEKRKQLVTLNGENPEAIFQAALAEQKIDDITFVTRRLEAETQEMKVGI